MKHCCDRMGVEVARNCGEGLNRFRSADSLIEYVPKYDEYGIIVRDGGSSTVQKLDAYKANPDAFDNEGYLKNTPTPEIGQRVIDGRINHL